MVAIRQPRSYSGAGRGRLLALASLLLPAGMLADRYGRARIIRLGLFVFVAASLCCAAATSAVPLIAAKFGQGAGAAFILPAALAALRGAHAEAAERARIFGIWAAWTGVASAAGPLLAGALVDLWSWRAVFLPSAIVGSLAIMLVPTRGSGGVGDDRKSSRCCLDRFDGLARRRRLPF